MKEIKKIHERFHDEIEDVKTYADMAEEYSENKHEYMHLAHQELEHAKDMYDLIMRHAQSKDIHREVSFECMKHSMGKALNEAREALQ